MRWNVLLCAAVVAVLPFVAARADDIPRDKPGFTNYMTALLQLYTREILVPAPINLEIRIDGTRRTIPLNSPFELCLNPKFDCSKFVDEFVRETVEEYLNLPKPDAATMRADWFLRAHKQLIYFLDGSDKGTPVRRVLDGMLTEHCMIDPPRHEHELRLRMLDDLDISRDTAFDICERNLRTEIGPLPDTYSQIGADHMAW